ncbi:MAG: hypothetical protein Q8L49_05640 [Burkholderiaceae bacterium]|nr:hypothetical protein [Burkholderiaceae bacterium]
MMASAKLRFLADTVLAEAERVKTTDGRLFALPMTPERAAGLRNRMIQEYVRDPAELASALMAAHTAVPLLADAAAAMARRAITPERG